MKSSPFAIYFAGVGTVVAAVAAGFGGAIFLTGASSPKEKTAIVGAQADGAKLSKIEKFEAAKRDEVAAEDAPKASTSTLLAAATHVPIDLSATAPANPPSINAAPPQPREAAAQPVPTRPAATQPAPKDGVQGAASFEGEKNAVAIKPSKKPIADAANPARKRQVAQRKARDVIIQSRQDDEDVPAIGYRSGEPGGYRVIEETLRNDRGTRIVRTYETRSRGFGGLFDSEDD